MGWYRQLHWQILIGMVVGALLGLFGGAELLPWYDWIGVLFLKLLKMVVVPLIVSSIVVGIARIGDPRQVGRLGGVTLLYYLGSSVLAIGTGMLVVNLLQPGVGVELGLAEVAGKALPPARSIREVLLDAVPANPIGAMAGFALGGGGGGLVGVIVFCVLFGMTTAALPARQRDPLVGFFDAVFSAMMRLTTGIIRLAPLGVASLLGVVLAKTGLDVILPLAGYMGTVIAALGIHFFVSLPLLVWLLARRSPWRLMRDVGLALTTAFTTASSNATLPIAMDCVEKKAGVDGRVGGFVLPLGATVNMDGSALYEGVAAIFIAQVYGIHLGPGEQALLFITALLASIGAAGIPHASLVMMAVVFEAVGLPLEAIGLLLGVDRVLTMCRTATNVWSDISGAAVVARLAGGALPLADVQEARDLDSA
jgi:proton glutamate symport protein